MNSQRGSAIDLTDLELSELTRAGYIVVQQPFTDIAFRVFHQEDEPGLLLRTLNSVSQARERGSPDASVATAASEHVAGSPMSESPDADGVQLPSDPATHATSLPARNRGSFAQTLATVANDMSLIVGTSTLPLDEGFRAPDGVHEDQAGCGWSGRSRTNPTFLYDSAGLIEGIVVLSEKPPPLTIAYANVLAEALRSISQAASDRDMPILTLQAPAHVPISDRTWARTVGGAVRFAVAVRRLDVEKRVEFLRQVVKFCTQRRLRLWIRDPSLTARTGSWMPAEIPGSVNFNMAGEQISHLLCTTIVGPARIGSSAAILECLGHVKGIGVAACSISALSDLAFIHLQLTGQFSPKLNLSTMYVDQFLEQLPTWVSAPSPWRDRSNSHAERAHNRVVERAKHYRCMFGPSLEPKSTGAIGNDETRPVWVSWQLPPQVDLAVLLDGLSNAMRRIVGDGPAGPGYNIEYLISRGVGGAGVRGRAKLSVPLAVIESAISGNDDPTRGKEFCSLLENMWRAELEAKRDAMPTELTVSWREYWLGHWAVEL